MTVPNENTVDSFTLTGTGQTLNLSYTFLDETHLRVMLNQSEVALVLNSDYSVTEPAKLGQLGSVTMSPGTGIATDVITVELDPPCTQLTVFRENSRFPAKVNEATHDQAYMLACKAVEAIFGAFGIVIRYPRFEAGNGVSNVIPILADRLAGGAGTLFGWKGTDGAPDVVSKGVLDTLLTLSNDSTLGGGSPDPVNGVTQRVVALLRDALQAEIDAIEAGTGLNADGTFIPYVGARFLDGFDAILAATTQKEADEILDAVLETIVDVDLPALNSRLGDLEGAVTKISQGTLGAASATITLTKSSDQSWDLITATVQWQLLESGNLRYDSISVTGGVASEVTNFLKGDTYNMQIVDAPTGEDLHYPTHILKFIPTNKSVNSLVITINYTLNGKQSQHTAYAEGTTI